MPLSDWLYVLLFSIILFAIVGLAEYGRRSLNWSTEATRKMVRMLAGLVTALTPLVLHSLWLILIPGLFFAMLDFMPSRRGLFIGIHGSAHRTLFYSVSFLVLALFLWHHHKLIFVTAMLILAFSDAADIVGKSVKKPVVLDLGPEKKSLQGSAAMFLATFLIVMIVFQSSTSFGFYDLSLGRILWTAFVVGVMAMALQLISVYGSDNLTVPLGSAFCLFYMLTQPRHDIAIFTLGMLLALLIALLSFRLRFLDGSGSGALFLLGTLVFGVGRWPFSVPILVFFVLSSILSKVGKKRKKKLLSVFEKSGRRDAGQVFANGGVAGLMLLLWYFTRIDFFYVFYIVALAAVTADTWATEIGVMATGQPRSIVNFKPVPMGTSGGVSLAGLFGSALGACLIAVLGFLFPHSSPHVFGWQEAVLVLCAGVFAALVDSWLGATVQAQFQCPACGKVTERKIHCHDHKTEFIHGFLWINNDVVNAFCAVAGVLFAWAIWVAL